MAEPCSQQQQPSRNSCIGDARTEKPIDFSPPHFASAAAVDLAFFYVDRKCSLPQLRTSSVEVKGKKCPVCGESFSLFFFCLCPSFDAGGGEGRDEKRKGKVGFKSEMKRHKGKIG